MLQAAEIRQKFLDFFAEKGHQIVPSAPLVIKGDPTLMFTNAGMNQFKEYFLGIKTAPSGRIADTQKCLRVSGKHNDLEEVGVDTYHHTMFEMLGNWSFDDYFKKEAIHWSWELLTDVYGIPKDRLYVTVFEGDKEQNIPVDDEAMVIWKELIAEDRILLGNKKDNFWEMGDTGPCGPCTEIHVDCRTDEERQTTDGKALVNADHPQVIEIWNNVFIQFEKLKDGSLVPLKGKYVDTGMGFERLVRVLQNKSSNYDTDVFSGTITAIEKITGMAYGGTDSKQDVAFRVLSDHIRAISFAISDGQLPSSNGAGYVIRRILRRAVRYYYTYLNHPKALLYQLVDVIAAQFENVFNELYNQKDLVRKVIKEEEESFLKTLEKGLRRMDEYVQNNAAKTISGDAAFELYDTYGFPLDLTTLIAQEHGVTVDEVGFTEAMKKQKDRSRAATSLETYDWQVLDENTPTDFVGYAQLDATSKITKYRQVVAKNKTYYQLVLDHTPFYAEGGGQVGDKGSLTDGVNTLEIFDVKKENDLPVHFTAQNPEAFVGKTLTAQVNSNLRKATESNHSATHLLHAALRQILGTHVAQKGSLVNNEGFRFDFSHFAKITPEELKEIENIVNQKIREGWAVDIQQMPKADAEQLGAMALFGEKYGDTVRVVRMDPSYSIELCGGTHVKNTKDIGLFKITSESSVAAGVRRIEALTGEGALALIDDELHQLQQIKQILPAKNIVKEIEKLVLSHAENQKKLEAYHQKEMASIAQSLESNIETINGIPTLITELQGHSIDDIKQIAFKLKSASNPGLIAISSSLDGKYGVVISIDESIQKEKNWDASAFIKQELSKKIQGGGGGQKFLATGAGSIALPFAEFKELVLSQFKS